MFTYESSTNKNDLAVNLELLRLIGFSEFEGEKKYSDDLVELPDDAD